MKQMVLIAAVGILAGIARIGGQDLGTDGKLYQVLGPSISENAVLDQGFSSQVVRGMPFSATEELHSLQILRDGTRIENTRKNRLFRDGQGRTRMETMSGAATIFDPVAGFRAELDPVTKTARRNLGIPLLVRNIPSAPSTGGSKGVASETTEKNLKPQLVNGVMAQGVRATLTIRKGEIGNDREIKVVTERWVSNDLQMLIKSTNTDPRFGETIYQLTGIVRSEPDGSLFQIPGDYMVINEGGRGGRGTVPGGRSPAGGRSPVPGGRSGRPAGRSANPE